MAANVTVELIPTTDPQPVRISAAELPVGESFVVVGVTPNGSEWQVPGGVGIVPSDGTLNLIDNRSAVNVPIYYEVRLQDDAETRVQSNTLTVVYPEGRYLLQSLDGQLVAAFVWRRDGLPREYVINSVTYPVRGRRRPPGRFAPGGDGGGAYQLRTDRLNTQILEEMLLDGGPLVLRTDGQVRDLPAVELLLPDQARTQVWDAWVNGGLSDSREWSLGYILTDDPEPSTVVTVWDWDDFDDFWAGQSWDDFDAYFEGSDWDTFDTTAWE